MWSKPHPFGAALVVVVEPLVTVAAVQEEELEELLPTLLDRVVVRALHRAPPW